MVLSDQYLQISAKLDTTFCYGFGEHEDESFVMNFNWTKLGMFSRDEPPWVNNFCSLFLQRDSSTVFFF